MLSVDTPASHLITSSIVVKASEQPVELKSSGNLISPAVKQLPAAPQLTSSRGLNKVQWHRNISLFLLEIIHILSLPMIWQGKPSFLSFCVLSVILAPRPSNHKVSCKHPSYTMFLKKKHCFCIFKWIWWHISSWLFVPVFIVSYTVWYASRLPDTDCNHFLPISAWHVVRGPKVGRGIVILDFPKTSQDNAF